MQVEHERARQQWARTDEAQRAELERLKSELAAQHVSCQQLQESVAR